MLKGLAFLSIGMATIAFAWWHWTAWRDGKPLPGFVRLAVQPRTEMNRIVERFALFGEVILGLALIVVGAVILNSPSGNLL